MGVATSHPKVSVRKGREWQIAHGHPWLFSGGISQAPKVPAGSLVDLVDVDGKFIARGYFNAECDIAVRVLTTDSNVQIDRSFFEQAITKAARLRDASIDRTRTNVFRMINAEGDFLPGYIVDYYDGVVVVQSHTAGGDHLLPIFLEALQAVLNPRAVILRNDASVRKREGLEQQPPKVIHGSFQGEMEVMENGLRFVVDPLQGQKTGFFTDQRDKRLALQKYCRALPPDCTLANCFSYSGSFAVYARAANGSMHTVNVDESQLALNHAHRNFSINSLAAEQQEFVNADAFAWMESQQSKGTQFNIVIVDPPAFAKTQKDKPKALKAYKRMDKLAISITKPGGLLVTCSCSGSVSLPEFEEALKEAVQESGRSLQIIETFKHGGDHPVSAVTPEANYLKVLFCRVV